MRVCWATCLGDCDGPLTREHLVSANVLGPGPIKIRGLPWCREEFREIGVGSLTRNMLCESHNHRLSPLDQAGGQAWREFSIFTVSARRALTMPPTARTTGRNYQKVNGAMLERWLLKTLVNLIVSSGEPRGDAWIPPQDWVDIIFGRMRFPERCGLYFEKAEHTLPHTDDYLALLVRTYPGTNLPCAGQMKINGWGVIVTMLPLSEEVALHRPLFLNLEHRARVFRSMRLNWPEVAPPPL